MLLLKDEVPSDPRCRWVLNEVKAKAPMKMEHVEPLIIKGGRSLPSVHMDVAQGIYRIQGVSMPENAREFYAPVIDWIRRAVPHMQNESVFSISLSYFNSSSMKAIYLALVEIGKDPSAGKGIRIEWHVEDDDDVMTEAGLTFSEMLGSPLVIVQGLLE